MYLCNQERAQDGQAAEEYSWQKKLLNNYLCHIRGTILSQVSEYLYDRIWDFKKRRIRKLLTTSPLVESYVDGPHNTWCIHSTSRKMEQPDFQPIGNQNIQHRSTNRANHVRSNSRSEESLPSIEHMLTIDEHYSQSHTIPSTHPISSSPHTHGDSDPSVVSASSNDIINTVYTSRSVIPCDTTVQRSIDYVVPAPTHQPRLSDSNMTRASQLGRAQPSKGLGIVHSDISHATISTTRSAQNKKRRFEKTRNIVSAPFSSSSCIK